MNNEVTVVGLGASAGGLDALIEFFDHISPDIPVAFVVTMHLQRDFESKLDEILQLHTQLPVLRVEADIEIEPSKVYVLIENKMLTIVDGHIHIEKRGEEVMNFAVNEFFESLAAVRGQNSIVIIFSGAGSDGLEGAKSISQGGGMVMVQDPATASVKSMPNAVIIGDHPQEIQSPKELARSLNKMFFL